MIRLTTVLLFGLIVIANMIAPRASRAWAPNALPVTNQFDQQEYPHCVSDDNGGMIAVWRDSRGADLDLYAQRLDRYGNRIWSSDIPVYTGAGNDVVGGSDAFALVPDGAGGVYVAFVTAGYDIRAQWVTSTGTRPWGVTGVVVCNANGVQTLPAAAPHPTDGIVVAWADQRSGGYDIYAQQITSAGTAGWTANGVGVCTAANDQYDISMIFDGNGGNILTWLDLRSGATSEIYVQSITEFGTANWTANGILVHTSANTEDSPVLVSNDNEGALVFWRTFGATQYVRYRIVEDDGSLPFFTATVASSSDNIDDIYAVSDGAGGAIVSYQDESGGIYDVWAARVGTNGALHWRTEMASSSSNQVDPRIVSDGVGGAVVTWKNLALSPQRMYGQRVNQDGTTLWGSFGQPMGGPEANSYDITTNGSGGAMTVFESSELGFYRVYAQRVEGRFGAWGHAEPLLTSVDDVAGDQGGYVSVGWLASEHDALGSTFVDYYTIWRATSSFPRGAEKYLVEAPSRITKDWVGPAYYQAADFLFELAGTQDAVAIPGYSYATPTTANSITHTFQVIAHNGSETYVSDTQTGESYDNLAPAPASALTAVRTFGDNVDLDWLSSGSLEPDFSDYVVFRGTNPGGPYTEVLSTTETDETDPAATAGTPYWYVVRTRDINGNLGAPTNEAMVPGNPTGVGDTPSIRGVALLNNVPNPFSAGTMLRIGLEKPSQVKLEVFDVAGRRVMQRDLGRLSAGFQDVSLRARGDDGKLLPSGVYFYRVSTPAATQTRKMVIRR